MADPKDQIPVQCPHCDATYKVGQEYLKRSISCPSCKKRFVVEQGVRRLAERLSPGKAQSPQAESRKPEPPSPEKVRIPKASELLGGHNRSLDSGGDVQTVVVPSREEDEPTVMLTAGAMGLGSTPPASTDKPKKSSDRRISRPADEPDEDFNQFYFKPGVAQDRALGAKATPFPGESPLTQPNDPDTTEFVPPTEILPPTSAAPENQATRVLSREELLQKVAQEAEAGLMPEGSVFKPGEIFQTDPDQTEPGTVNANEPKATFRITMDDIQRRKDPNAGLETKGLAEKRPSGGTVVAPQSTPNRFVSYHASVVFDLIRRREVRSSLSLEPGEGEARIGPREDRYSQVRELARGGMGKVELVRDNDLNRLVAKKTVLKELTSNKQIIERFVEEAQASGQLEHPNIVPVHELGVDEHGNLYFTMKYIKGRTVAQVIRGLKKKDDPEGLAAEYTLTRLLQIFLQICNAMSFAHSKKVIHRDLKPANIMLGAFGEVIVMDWGLAKVLTSKHDYAKDEVRERVETLRSESGDQTQIGTVVGTPAYMPPEQAKGEISELDERSDVYSLAAILYEMLCLESPFHSNNMYSIINRLLNEEPEPPQKLAKAYHRQIPREMAAIALKGLSKDKAQRYQSVRELADDVQRFLEGREVLALPDSLMRKVGRWSRRNQTTLSWLVALVVLVGGAGAGGWWYYTNQTVSRFLAEGGALMESARRVETSGQRDESGGYAWNAGKERRLLDLYTQAVTSFRKVLDFDRHNADALKSLSSASLAMWQIALRNENTSMMTVLEQDIRRFMGPTYEGSPEQRRIEGRANLQVTTDPPGAEISLFRYEEAADSRLIPVPFLRASSNSDPEWLERWNSGQLKPPASGRKFPTSVYYHDNTVGNRWGVSPVKAGALLPGSYLVVATLDGYQPLRVPVRVNRLQDAALTVRMMPAGRIPPGYVFIPETTFVYGGTSAGAARRQERTAGNLFLREQEVTMGEYAEYLKHLVHTGREAEARQRLPRDFAWTFLAIQLGEVIPTEQLPGLDWREQAVKGVSYLDCLAFLEWLSQRDNLPYRLPTEEEWELAARGVDGRKYSWGNHYKLEFARLTQGYGEVSEEQIRQLNAQTEFVDESPFGLKDMAGNVAEWVEGFFDPTVTKATPATLRIIRGNAWGLTPIGLETAFRTSGPADYFHATIGFRYGYTVPETR